MYRHQNFCKEGKVATDINDIYAHIDVSRNWRGNILLESLIFKIEFEIIITAHFLSNRLQK